jgi:DNA-binding transcriptional regulator YiaG
MRDDVKMPVRQGGGKAPLEPEVAERAILNALRAMVKQSKMLADADYSCSFTVRQLRLHLKKKPEDFAAFLGVSLGDYEKWETRQSPADVAKTMAYTAKVIDETYRLLSFSQGGADSRTELTLGDLLKYLTSDQFEMFTQWVEEGKKRGETVTPQITMQ